jgi:hypothetical protein
VSLLGPLDDAARGVVIGLLGPEVPVDREAQRAFFAPDLGALPPGEADTHQNYGRNLRQTVVDHTGMMPIGLLNWCLRYAGRSQRNVGGVFAVVKSRFAPLAQTDLPVKVGQIYGFRNQYVAHQDMELTDVELARHNLKDWAVGLHRIWSAYHE